MPKYKKNDVIGCGINFFKKEIFFTYNGELKGPAFKDIELCDFHATIGLHSLNECVTMNFGKREFMLSLEQLILDEKKNTIQQILEEQIHHYDVHKIVHNYLYFHGFYETLNAFEKASNFQREDTVLLRDFEKKIEIENQNNNIEIEKDNQQIIDKESSQQQQQQQIDIEPTPASKPQLNETDFDIQLEEIKEQKDQKDEKFPLEEQKQEIVEEEEEKKDQIISSAQKLIRGMRAVSCHIDLETPELGPRKVSNISDLFELSLVAKEQNLDLQKSNSVAFFEKQMGVLTSYDIERQNIRYNLMEGKIQEVIKSLENHFPQILEDNPSLLLQLKSQIFIEIIKNGDIIEAVKYATDNFSSSQSETIKAYNLEGKLEDKTLEDLLGLICYTKPEESNLRTLMSNNQRDLVADLVHKQILKSLNFSNKSILELMICQLMQIEEEFKQTNQFYGSIFEFKVQ